MSETVVLTDHIFPDTDVEREIIESVGAEFVFVEASTPEQIIESADNPTGIMTTYTDIDASVFEAFQDLEFVSVYGIGVDMVDVDAATEHGVPVFHVPDYCVEEVATHTVGMILSCERRLGEYYQDVKSSGWEWELGQPIRRLSTTTVGIVGLGRIGQHLAEQMQGFGVELIGYDPYLTDEKMAEHGVESVDFETLCCQADIITLHTPLNDSTENIIDADALELMEPETALINAARGKLIDETALYNSLSEGKLAYAGLDVLRTEPPEDDRLLNLDNVFVTPHVAWYSEDALDELQRRTAENAARALGDDKLQNVVNPSVLNR